MQLRHSSSNIKQHFKSNFLYHLGAIEAIEIALVNGSLNSFLYHLGAIEARIFPLETYYTLDFLYHLGAIEAGISPYLSNDF